LAPTRTTHRPSQHQLSGVNRTWSGLGERAHLMNRALDLDTHVQDIVGVFRCEELSDVVLCGHSYGTGVAEQIAAKIRSLVYLDAFVPENGKSLFDYLPAEQSGQMRDDAAQNGEGYKVHAHSGGCFRRQCTGRRLGRCD
jgi:pimeloyl-ACP methyl ester carboxylesterase